MILTVELLTGCAIRTERIGEHSAVGINAITAQRTVLQVEKDDALMVLDIDLKEDPVHILTWGI